MTCSRIGCNLAPTTKNLQITDKGIIGLKLPTSNFENQLSLPRIIPDEEEYNEMMAS